MGLARLLSRDETSPKGLVVTFQGRTVKPLELYPFLFGHCNSDPIRPVGGPPTVSIQWFSGPWAVESHYHLKKTVGFCISEILWLGGAGGVEEVGSPFT